MNRHWLDSLLNLIYPPACEVCRQKGPEVLCPDCFSQIKFMRPQLGTYSASVYDGVIKTSLHRFKFQKRKNLAGPLGVMLVKYISQNASLSINEINCIVPVPLHKKRLRERGFNQVELLAQMVSRYYELPVVPALERIRETHPQFDLPKNKRLENVKAAFRVNQPSSVYNKKVLLLDDIYTTGATTHECTRALKIAGAKRVEILTLARAVEI